GKHWKNPLPVLLSGKRGLRPLTGVRGPALKRDESRLQSGLLNLLSVPPRAPIEIFGRYSGLSKPSNNVPKAVNVRE
ncbi:hypothetical protein, partial [Mesorhizobium sp.]|uniref:hypothetical protein n=1 Tax=Mesorhizobium sp. TaxID=1871066 RepID=UPI0025801C28